MLKEVFNDDAKSAAGVFEWYKGVSEGREEVVDDELPDWPVTARAEGKELKINDIWQKDRRLSNQMDADMLNINKETLLNTNFVWWIHYEHEKCKNGSEKPHSGRKG